VVLCFHTNSSVYLPEHNVNAAQNGNRIGEFRTDKHVLKRLKRAKTGAAVLGAEWFFSAVRNQVHTQLTSRNLGGTVTFDAGDGFETWQFWQGWTNFGVLRNGLTDNFDAFIKLAESRPRATVSIS
jgi:hypothetical protein